MYLLLSNGGRLLFSGEKKGGALLLDPLGTEGGSTITDKQEKSRAIAKALRARAEQSRMEAERARKSSKKARKREQEKFEEIIAPVIREIELQRMDLPEADRRSMVERLLTVPAGFDMDMLHSHLLKIHQIEVEMKRRKEAAQDEDEAIALILLSMN